MLKRVLVLLAGTLVLVFLKSVNAEEEVTLPEATTLRLVCNYKETLIFTGWKETHGTFLVSVWYRDPKYAELRRDDRDMLFLGSVSEEEIKAHAGWDSGNTRVTEDISINRYTGTFRQESVHVGKERDTFSYRGTCDVAEKRKF